jgi:hypothetical protein
MSNKKLCKICHKKGQKISVIKDNQGLTKILVPILRNYGLNPKDIAREADIPTERVKSWYFKGVGLTAIDLIKMGQQYDFIKAFVQAAMDSPYAR